MTGGPISHARTLHSLALAIGPAARAQGCETFTSDAMVRIGDTIAYYRDVMICCDADDDDEQFRFSPCLVVEVLLSSSKPTRPSR
jgi:Uma2 family endonuclease